MKVTTYSCDRCAATVERPEDLMSITIFVALGGCSYSTPSHSAEWCRSCVVNTGMKEKLKPGKDDVPPDPEHPPSFESLLRELIREEIGSEQ